MKYCPEIIIEISDHIRQGRTQKDAAILSGISEAIFYEWLKDSSKVEFLECIKKAQSEFKKQLEIRVQKAADVTWQAAAWMLERRFKDDYALRTEYTGKDGQELKLTIIHPDKDITDKI